MTGPVIVVDVLDEEGRQTFVLAGLSLGVVASGSRR